MRHLKNTKRLAGFTIVELLVVVVVIAILAAITIVSYNGITRSATESAVKGELSNNAKLIEIYRIDNGQYPAPPVASIGIAFSPSLYNLTRNNIYYCTNSATDQFILSAIPKNSPGGKGFAYISDQGIIEMPIIDQALSCGKIGITTVNGSIAPLGYTSAGAVWAAWIKRS